MGTRLSLVGLAVVLAFATGAVAAGPGPGPIAPGPNGPNGDAVQVEGVIITEYGGGVLTLETLDGDIVVVRIEASTVIWIGDEIVAPDSLVVDMTVVVCGSLNEDGDLVAERINVKYVGQ